MAKDCNHVFCFAVWGCAVSPTGDKLYRTNSKWHKLLTLTRNGSVLSIFMDPELAWPTCVHVTPAGQVLVCIDTSKIFLHIDNKGSRMLTTLATETDWPQRPFAVIYISNNDSIIVGMWLNDKIRVQSEIAYHSCI
ncbi:hypothetical protein DPMN_045970 [Dreissena polymorpha]|uniref:Uncharacterized protein n=1 Tax=Dreissena polymorpha TaxID=45954 RepID=A0A9D4D5Z4_DREPO|nr:hypothetical protein DPMN_045970 [Dreissena polymorpha]